MQNTIVRVYRACPDDTDSVSGLIEDIESGRKEPFHSLGELQTLLASSIGRGQLELPGMALQETNFHENFANVAYQPGMKNNVMAEL
jgi:hypothetical protein